MDTMIKNRKTIIALMIANRFFFETSLAPWLEVEEDELSGEVRFDCPLNTLKEQNGQNIESSSIVALQWGHSMDRCLSNGRCVFSNQIQFAIFIASCA